MGKNRTIEPVSFSLEDVQKIAESSRFKEKTEKVKDSFEFAANEKNFSMLIKSAWKSLKRTDPDSSYKRAVNLAHIMQSFAQTMIKKIKK